MFHLSPGASMLSCLFSISYYCHVYRDTFSFRRAAEQLRSTHAINHREECQCQWLSSRQAEMGLWERFSLQSGYRKTSSLLRKEGTLVTSFTQITPDAFRRLAGPCVPPRYNPAHSWGILQA